jgi:hypothetical protein
MQNLIPLIVIGLFVYLMFFRRGGMGCCGSHGSHDSGSSQKGNSGRSSNDHLDTVVDLSEDDYAVSPSKNDKRT